MVILKNEYSYSVVANTLLNHSKLKVLPKIFNDPFGQPTVSYGFDFPLRRTDNLCEDSDHYRPWLWSASWIKNDHTYQTFEHKKN